MSGRRHHRRISHAWMDKTLEWGVICIWVLIPLAWGAVHTPTFSLLSLFVWTLAGLMGAKIWIDSKRFHRSEKNNRHQILPKLISLIPISLIMLIVLGLAQLVPLPLEVLNRISPKAAEYHNLAKSIVIVDPGNEFPASLYPFATISTLLKSATYLLFFLLSLYVFKKNNDNRFEKILVIWTAVGCFESALGIAQTLGGMHNFLWWKVSISVGRARGTFIYVNHYGAYLQLTLFAMIGWLLARISITPTHYNGADWKRRLLNTANDDRLLKNMILGFCCMLVGTALLISSSRGSIITFVLVLIFFHWWWLPAKMNRKQRMTIIAVFFAMLFTSYYLGLEPTVKRFMRLDHGLHLRWELSKAAFEYSRDFPIIGSGLGTFEEVFRSYIPEYRDTGVVFAGKVVDHAHNDWVELCDTAGYYIAGAIAIFTIILFFALCRRISKRRYGYRKYLAAGLVCGTISVFIHSVADFLFMCPAVSMLCLASIGWAAVVLQKDDSVVGDRANNHTKARKNWSLIWQIPVAIGCTAIYGIGVWNIVSLGVGELVAPTEINSTVRKYISVLNEDVLLASKFTPQNAALWAIYNNNILKDQGGHYQQLEARSVRRKSSNSSASPKGVELMLRDICEDNIIRNPTNPNRYAEYAYVVLSQDRKLPLIDKCLATSIFLEPTNGEWYYRRGQAALWRDDKVLARQMLEKSVIIDPAAYWNLADRLVPDMLAKGNWGNVDPEFKNNWLSVAYVQSYDYAEGRPK